MFNKPLVVDVDTAPFAEIDALPEFLRDKMKASEEYSELLAFCLDAVGRFAEEARGSPNDGANRSCRDTMDQPTIQRIGVCNCQRMGCQLYETLEGYRFCATYVDPWLVAPLTLFNSNGQPCA
jgi:hypothetical protein